VPAVPPLRRSARSTAAPLITEARVTLAAVAVVIVIAGCSGTGAGSSAASGSATGGAHGSAPVTASTATVTTSSTTTTTAPAGPSEASPTPRLAIEKFVAAWSAGDRAAAQRIARPAAVNAVFAQSSQGFALYGCDSGEFDTSTCNYRNRGTGGYAQITAAKTPGGWVVDTAFLAADG
jgi:hypothetical protein